MIDKETAVLLVAVVAGFCAGVLNSFAWLGVMRPNDRDAFLRGALDGMNPAFWLRKLRGTR